jgi:hypothetical protein
VPIISQQGEVSGRLHLDIQRVSGSLDCVSMDTGEDEEYGEEIEENTLTCRLNIKGIL